ncbi:MAG: alpha-hydroxy acid oxidase [Actinomycetota bacterium]
MEEFERAARDRLPEMVFDYFAGGAGDEWTLAENRRALGRWLLRPRILNDVSNVDLATSVLGQSIPFPIVLAPTALQRMAHRDGELATARAAKSLGALMILSTISTFSMEEVAAVGVDRWFQLYVHKDRGLTEELVRRAVDSGYGAIVLTVDAPFLGRRYRDERNRFSLPPGIALANLASVDVPRSEGSDLFAYFAAELDPGVTWRDIEWLRALSTLPVVLKGILTEEDAILGVEAGVDAVVVSNHGGRQLDGVPASIDALPAVAGAVEGRAEVLVDGGIRSGADVLKALALGARAVLIGRPYLWGLAVDGEAGVRRILELLRDELRLAAALAGCASVRSVDRSAVTRASS